MKNKDKIILIKILKYIEELHSFITEYTYDNFKNDKKNYKCLCFQFKSDW